ncbi:hypothetical protein DH2020_026811 [Rehmannia glutinosa]|uniref:Cell cycle checkpoint control protein n=1 Tax=Rehmannia glutinosa TaxID=99300 RepID=A0ABR0VVX4_REHGL
MEFSLSGNALKTFARSITCLSRIGNELVFQSSPSQVPVVCLFSVVGVIQFSLHTLNSSRSAYQSITFKPDFFDVYTVSDAQVNNMLMLFKQAICSVLRTPIASIDHLSVLLADSDASKVRWTLDCFNESGSLGPILRFFLPSSRGESFQKRKRKRRIERMFPRAIFPGLSEIRDERTSLAKEEFKEVHYANSQTIQLAFMSDLRLVYFHSTQLICMRKAYWITCNIEPDIQHLSLDRRKLPSSFVVRPRDLNRLLANFQSSLQEITIIATQPSALPPDAADQIGGKAVELRSYIDPTKENDSSLHTQLWIDPTEEFVQYTHSRDPVDVTFGVKELKAFLSFCEGCEVDVHLYFDKAGEPILMAPKFGLDDDGSSANFDATLVLATMLASQLNAANSSAPPPATTTGAPAQHGTKGNTSEHPSDHTKIWSELSGSAAKDGNGAEDRQVPGERNQNTNEQRTIQRIGAMNISTDKNADGMPACRVNSSHPMETDNPGQPQDGADINGNAFSQRHPSNWVDADEDDDEGDETELCVQSTPPYL